MKAHILLIILLVCTTMLSAQVRINNDGNAPDASAMLDVKSTTMGVLIPRMTAAQLDAIASPANGLMIFCTDNNQYYFNKGTPAAKNWVMVNSQWLTNASDIYYNAGNLGIGTSTPHAPLQFSNATMNRKIVFYENLNNDHNFYGFGINGAALRYQVDATSASHVFYAGTSSTTSAELMRIRGDGKVGIGINDLSYKLEIANDNLGNTSGNTVLWQRIRGQSANTDQLQIFHRRYTAGTGWESAEIKIQKVVDATAMHYISFKGGTVSTLGYLVFGFQNTEQMVITNDGNIGIGTSNPEDAAILDISSTSRGFLVPRMNTSEIALIQNPANGLMVYNTADGHLFIYTASGNAWKRVANDATAITPFTCGVPFPDGRDGKTYQTVQIGTQCWMAQNMNIGTRINGSGEQTNNSTIEKYCYNDLESNCNVYGGLYQWAEMVQYFNGATNTSSWNPVPTGNVTGICPTGWHIPTDAEWTTVTTFLGGESVAGGKMKSTGTIEAGTGLWYSPNTGATNESGFTALPAGFRSYEGTFYYVGLDGYWWSSSEFSFNVTWSRGMHYFDSYVHRGEGSHKYFGFSVRCLRDF